MADNIFAYVMIILLVICLCCIGCCICFRRRTLIEMDPIERMEHLERMNEVV